MKPRLNRSRRNGLAMTGGTNCARGDGGDTQTVGLKGHNLLADLRDTEPRLAMVCPLSGGISNGKLFTCMMKLLAQECE